MIFQFYGSGFVSQAVTTLAQWGVIDALLPFALIFATMYAILQQAGPFKMDGKPNKRVNMVFALCTATLFVVPHILGPSNLDYVPWINAVLPQFALLLLAVVLVLTLTGLTGGPESVSGKNGWLAWAALILLLFLLVNAVWPNFFGFSLVLDPGLLGLLIALSVFGLVVWYVVKEDTPEKK